jgi:hypothetical protein
VLSGDISSVPCGIAGVDYLAWESQSRDAHTMVLPLGWGHNLSGHLGLWFFSVWPSHVPRLDSPGWVLGGTIPRSSSPRGQHRCVSTYQSSFYITLANVPMTKASLMAKPRINVGSDYTLQSMTYSERWPTVDHVPLWALPLWDSVAMFFFMWLTCFISELLGGQTLLAHSLIQYKHSIATY